MSNLRAWLGEKSPEEIEHFLGNIPCLWLEGGQVHKLYSLLSNYDFIEAKTNHSQFGLKTLLEDYNLLDNPQLLKHPDYNEQTIKSLKLIQRALRLSANILIQDTKQLAGQLSGRLLDFDVPEIHKLLQQISQAPTTCLHSLKASLTPPSRSLESTLIGHTDFVNAVAVTPDGKRIISGSSDNTVKVWDLNTGAEVLTFTGHASPVNAVAVAVTPDGTRVISGSSDNTVRVWNLEEGTETLTFNGHSLPVVAVAVTPDGKKVVSASIATINSIKVWDLATGKEELTLKGHGDLVRTVSIPPENQIISASDDGTIKVWNLTNGQALFRHIHGQEDAGKRVVSEPVYAIAITSDGKWLISSSGYSQKSTNIVIVWNLEAHNYYYNYYKYSPKLERFILKGHNSPISAIAVTPDGKKIISASFDNTIKIWDIQSRKEIYTFTAHDQSISDITVTLDGKKIISASRDKTVKVWDLEFISKQTSLIENQTSVNDVVITSDGRQAIFCSPNNLIKIFDLEKNDIVASFYSTHNLQNNIFVRARKIFEKYILLIAPWLTRVLLTAFSLLLFIIYIIIFALPYFRLIFCLSVNVSKSFWHFIKAYLQSKNKIPQLFKKRISEQKIELSKYSKYSEVVKEIIPHFESNKFIGLEINSNNFLICINNQIPSSCHFLTVWNYTTFKRIYDFISISQYCYIYLYLLRYIVYLSIIVFFCLSAKSLFTSSLEIIIGTFLLIALLYIPDQIFYQKIISVFYESATAISITPDGKYLISGSTNSSIKVWDMQNKKLLFVLKGHQKKVTTLTTTPDGKYLMSGSDDQTIKIWNLQTRKHLFTLTGHGDSVNTISVTPDGKYLLSGSDDKTIKIWDLENREEIFTFTGHTESINSINVTSNGQLVISASSDKTIQVWDFVTRKLIAKFTGESAMTCSAIAPDNITIVAGDTDGNAHFLRLQGIEV